MALIVIVFVPYFTSSSIGVKLFSINVGVVGTNIPSNPYFCTYTLYTCVDCAPPVSILLLIIMMDFNNPPY